MLTVSNPSNAVRFMQNSGLLPYVVPELQKTVREEQSGPYHDKDVFEHTMKVLDSIPEDLVLRLSALLHDIGKPATKTIVDDVAHFFGHEAVGAEMTRAILRRLKFPKEIIDQVSFLVANHMRPHAYTKDWTDAAVRRLIKKLGDKLEHTLTLAEADVTGQRHGDEGRQVVKDLRDRIRQIQEAKPVESIPELFSGNELMAEFNLGQGSWIRKMKEFLVDLQMENPNITREEALPLAKKWFEEHKDEIMAKGAAEATWFQASTSE